MNTFRRVTAIIPARGGSKGVPRKNIVPLLGRPMLAYSILAAQQAQAVDRVVVSTEDTEIAAVAKDWGAEVVPRSPELATDEAPTDPVLVDVVNHLEQTEGYRPDLVVLLQPTSPLRPSGLVDACIDRLVATEADSLLTVHQGHHFFWRRQDGRLEANYDPARRPRRQDIPEQDCILLENGSVYVTRTDILLEHHSRLAGKVEWYEMSANDSVEIDTPEDLPLAEFLLKSRGPSQDDPRRLDNVRLIVSDFDGVLTDNRVLVHQDGTEAVMCDRSDGWGVARLIDIGLEVLVLSTETNPVVAARCRKLGIKWVQGCDDKLTALQAMAQERSLKPEQIAYVGNDVNDLACMGWVGVPIAPADATQEVKAISRLTTISRGGHGVLREVAEWILSRRGCS